MLEQAIARTIENKARIYCLLQIKSIYLAFIVNGNYSRRHFCPFRTLEMATYLSLIVEIAIWIFPCKYLVNKLGCFYIG